MERAKKTKMNLEGLFFVTPEQKLLRFLLSEPTTSFTPRVLSSKLKGVRGLGGSEGIRNILDQFEEMGIIHYLDNRRSVRLNDDFLPIQLMKTFVSVCELESLRPLLQPVSTKGVLFGSRASGEARSDSDYNIFVVTDAEGDVKNIVEHHPLGKKVELMTCKESEYLKLDKKEPKLAKKLKEGIVMWGTVW